MARTPILYLGSTDTFSALRAAVCNFFSKTARPTTPPVINTIPNILSAPNC